MVEVASAPVLNEPFVPVPPPAGEAQELLLVDDQVMSVLALFMIEFDAAERDTTGGAERTAPVISALVLSTDPPLPQATSTRLNKRMVGTPLFILKFCNFNVCSFMLL